MYQGPNPKRQQSYFFHKAKSVLFDYQQPQPPKPVFLLREVVVREISRFGKGEEHLKLKIASKDAGDRTIDAVTFFVRGTLARTADALMPGSRANVLAHIERDSFSRKNPVRLRLLDLRPV